VLGNCLIYFSLQFVIASASKPDRAWKDIFFIIPETLSGIITIIILLASSFGILKTVLDFMSPDITVSTLKWAEWGKRNLKRLYSNSFLELE
jgi:hypothetical protein